MGKFQIAPFLAILRDYNSETKIAIDITRVAANATTEAYGRNVALNKTLSAAINEATTNLKELAETLGQIGVTESLQNVLGFFNSLVSKIQEVLEGEGVGSEFARGLVKGIGNVISGPGLAIFGAIIAKLTIDLTRFGAASLQTFFGLNKTAKDIAATQGSIASTLLKNSDIQKQILAIENSTLSVEQKRAAQTQFFTQALNAQLATMKQMQGIAATIAPAVVAGARGGGRGRAAGGFIPNFDAVRGYGSETQDIKRGVGGAPSSARPVTIPNFNFGGGQRGTMVANTSEFIVPNYAGGGSAIFNQNMVGAMGMPSGARSLAAGGYIPNFNIEAIRRQIMAGSNPRGWNVQKTKDQLSKKELKQAEANMTARQAGLAKTSKDKRIAGGPFLMDMKSVLGGTAPKFLTPRPYGPEEITSDIGSLIGLPPERAKGKFTFQNRSLKPGGSKGQAIQQEFKTAFSKDRLDEFATKYTLNLARKIASVVGAPPVRPERIDQVERVKGFTGSIRGAMGAMFDAAISTAFKLESQDVDGGDFDYREKAEPLGQKAKGYMTALFGRGFTGSGSTFGGLADMKFGGGPDTKTSMVNKSKKEIMAKPHATKRLRKEFDAMAATRARRSASGYIPNFAGPLEDAVVRERAAGLPLNQIRINQDGRLRNADNPMGLAVTNVRDEPTGSIAAAAGYVPSYFSASSANLNPKMRGAPSPAAPSPAAGGDAMSKLLGVTVAMSMIQGQFQTAGEEISTFGKVVSSLTTTIMAIATVQMLNFKGGLMGVSAALKKFAASAVVSSGFGGVVGRGTRALAGSGVGRFAGGAAGAAGRAIMPAAIIGGLVGVMSAISSETKGTSRAIKALGEAAAQSTADIEEGRRESLQDLVSENKVTGGGIIGGASEFVNFFRELGGELGEIVGVPKSFRGSGGTKRDAGAIDFGGTTNRLDFQGVTEEGFESARKSFLLGTAAELQFSAGQRDEPLSNKEAVAQAEKIFELEIKRNTTKGLGIVIDSSSLANLKDSLALKQKQNKAAREELKIKDEGAKIEEKIKDLNIETARQRVKRALQQSKFDDEAIDALDQMEMRHKTLNDLTVAETTSLREGLAIRKVSRGVNEDIRGVIAGALTEQNGIKVSAEEYEQITKQILSLSGDQIQDTTKLKGIFGSLVKETATKVRLEELIEKGFLDQVNHLKQMGEQNKQRIKQEQALLSILNSQKIARDAFSTDITTGISRRERIGSAPNIRRRDAAQDQIRLLEAQQPTNAPAQRQRQRDIAEQRAIIARESFGIQRAQAITAERRRAAGFIRGQAGPLDEAALSRVEGAAPTQLDRILGDRNIAARNAGFVAEGGVRVAQQRVNARRAQIADVQVGALAGDADAKAIFDHHQKMLQIENRELAEFSAKAAEAKRSMSEIAAMKEDFSKTRDEMTRLETETTAANKALKATAGLKPAISGVEDAFIDFRDSIGQTIANLEKQLAITPGAADRARIERELGVKRRLEQEGTTPEKRLQILRESQNKGLGQTFAESEILNATDEERAQRMNELLRDGSVQFANNIGTAMHKAIRDGESFGDGLRNAGLAFLDYISEAMMQMAAQQVVGQFTSGMFGQGGASQTGGATAGGGFGSRLAGMFSGGGGGGGNVTGAALVGGNFSSGGLIVGGSGKRDDVPAVLTGGEFVMNRAAVADYGINFMKQLNERRIQGFANGGAVGGRDLFDPAFSGRALRGKGQLMGFAGQGVTSGAGDFIRGGAGASGSFGAVALQPGSIRGTQFQRRTDLMSKQRTESRKNALNLYFQQLESEDQRQKAWDAEQERLLKERLFKAEQERKRLAAEKARKEAEKRARRSSIGSFIGMALGSFLGPMGAAAGSMIGGSIGGSMATGGYAQGGGFGPIGRMIGMNLLSPDMLSKSKGSGAVRPSAGVDTVPTMLSGGEFVMNAAATRRIGRGNLSALNGGVGGASGSSNSALMGAIGQLIGRQSDSANNISITINTDGAQNTSVGRGSSQSAQSLAARIRDAVTEIIAEEKRLGGTLRSA